MSFFWVNITSFFSTNSVVDQQMQKRFLKLEKLDNKKEIRSHYQRRTTNDSHRQQVPFQKINTFFKKHGMFNRDRVSSYSMEQEPYKHVSSSETRTRFRSKDDVFFSLCGKCTVKM